MLVEKGSRESPCYLEEDGAAPWTAEAPSRPARPHGLPGRQYAAQPAAARQGDGWGFVFGGLLLLL